MQSVRSCLQASPITALEAEVLLAHVIGRDRSWLFCHAEEMLPREAHRRYQALVNQRQAGQPIAYLIGEREFWSLALKVNKHTLIPRPETELLVEQALAKLPSDKPCAVLDLGTGAGGVALAIAKERPLTQVTATDISSAALTLAQQNATRLRIDNVTFTPSDWCRDLGSSQFDLMVSNPPYVRSDDPHLDTGDCRWEPRTALSGGTDGLDAYRNILAQVPAHLRPGAPLLFEHGFDQASALATLLGQSGFRVETCHRDLSGHPRVTVATCVNGG